MREAGHTGKHTIDTSDVCLLPTTDAQEHVLHQPRIHRTSKGALVEKTVEGTLDSVYE